MTLRRAPIAAAGMQYVPGLLNVTYASEDAASAVDSAAVGMGGRTANAHFESLGLRARIVSVDPSRTQDAIVRLQHTPGVVSVEHAQYRRRMAAVNVNDPYYKGFGPGAPYFADGNTPGQWDMHVINVGTAWGLFNSLPAMGAPIAVIDTGVDVTHPDLGGGKIVHQACFVTFPTSAAQTTSGFAVDTDGHGTNVAGIADADTNNSFGFAGVAFDAPLLAYRIFPTTPSGGCEGSNPPAQCDTTDVDEVSAINDAVAHGAKVINLSLGANGPLSNCKDTIEENAVESAISQGVVVVAAAGNESTNSLDCPGAYPGVIAVGAEGPTGTADSTTNAQAVASYSNWTSASGPGGGGAYLIAPGGDASGSSDSNDLHFVENITSSQMADASQFCTTDFAGEAHDCRGGFAGTSQATPHVAGVASLMLGLHPNHHLSPAQIASDLCSTARNVGGSKRGCGLVDAGAAVALAATQ